MASNDPTDTGGLFIGRRPGTAPLRYRARPERAEGVRRRLDAVLADAILAVETLICMTLGLIAFQIWFLAIQGPNSDIFPR